MLINLIHNASINTPVPAPFYTVEPGLLMNQKVGGGGSRVLA